MNKLTKGENENENIQVIRLTSFFILLVNCFGYCMCVFLWVSMCSSPMYKKFFFFHSFIFFGSFGNNSFHFGIFGLWFVCRCSNVQISLKCNGIADICETNFSNKRICGLNSIWLNNCLMWFRFGIQRTEKYNKKCN